MDGSDVKMRAKMPRVIGLLELFGTELRGPYSKHLEEGIFELRAQARDGYSVRAVLIWSGGRFV